MYFQIVLQIFHRGAIVRAVSKITPPEATAFWNLMRIFRLNMDCSWPEHYFLPDSQMFMQEYCSCKTDVKIQKRTVSGLFEPVAEVEQRGVEDTDQEFVSHIKEIGEETLPLHLVEMYESGSKNLSLCQKEQLKKFLVKKQNVFFETS